MFDIVFNAGIIYGDAALGLSDRIAVDKVHGPIREIVPPFGIKEIDVRIAASRLAVIGVKFAGGIVHFNGLSARKILEFPTQALRMWTAGMPPLIPLDVVSITIFNNSAKPQVFEMLAGEIGDRVEILECACEQAELTAR